MLTDSKKSDTCLLVLVCSLSICRSVGRSVRLASWLAGWLAVGPANPPILMSVCLFPTHPPSCLPACLPRLLHEQGAQVGMDRPSWTNPKGGRLVRGKASRVIVILLFLVQIPLMHALHPPLTLHSKPRETQGKILPHTIIAGMTQCRHTQTLGTPRINDDGSSTEA